MHRIVALSLCLVAGPAAAQGPAPAGQCAQNVPATLEANTLGTATAHGSGFYRVDGVAPSPRSGNASGLSFELATSARVRRGQPLGVTVRAVNAGSTDTVALRSMDGSFSHMRAPYYDLYVREVGSTDVYRWDFHGGRCGMTNAVSATDFVPLAPGAAQSDVPGTWGMHLRDAAISKPGQYEMWLVYRLCEDFSGGGTVAGPAPTRGQFASNMVRVTVR